MSIVWLNQKVKNPTILTPSPRSRAQDIFSFYEIWRYSISLGTLRIIKESFEQTELV